MSKLAKTLLTLQGMTLLILIGFVSTLPAVEQLTQPQCDQLQKDLEKVRAEQRRGSKIRRANQLAEQQHQLEQQLFFYCDKPTAAKPAAASPARRRLPASKPVFSKVQRSFPQAMSSVVEIKAPYQGVQLQAWLAFYQEPRFCFGVRATDILVDCVHRRQQAMQQFEQKWQQNMQEHNLSDQQ